MKSFGILLSLLAIPAPVFGQSSSAAPLLATVRGMLQDDSAKKTAPASGLLVTVENTKYTSPAVRSGKDGLYYIPNLSPGNYTLKVWADPKKPLSFPITVDKGLLTDIPPVIVAMGNAAKSNHPVVKSKVPTGNKAKPTHPGSNP